MNRFLVVETLELSRTNRFVVAGVVRQGFISAGMQLCHPDHDQGFEIAKVELVDKRGPDAEAYVALLLYLDDVTDSGFNKPQLWLGKELHCN